ncbi:MAG: class I SAM-dependent methyltransferase [bacterium]
MYKEINKCRICGNTDLVSLLNLGEQTLTGVFPRSKDQLITKGPLELVKCQEDKDGNSCGLLQLRHSYDLNELYGENYGYRSALNKSMVDHLQGKIKKILNMIHLAPGDLILDIGSNDGTLLKAYPHDGLILVGIDPTGKKFKGYYPDYIQLISDFFSAGIVKQNFGKKKAKIITSIAMFYDLEAPMDFMRQVYEVLADDGIWVFEQSYMPTMLEMNAYDTICHEHLEYYCLKQIKWMTDRIGFKIIDVEFNDVNGGSFSITVAKPNSSYKECTSRVDEILSNEENIGLNTLKPYQEFKQRTFKHRDKLRQFIKKIKANNKLMLGYGASTKGNVILQFCNITEEDIPFMAEVNEDKFGCFTPGTNIPIISEKKAKKMKPDYFLVMPWHFKKNFLVREKKYLDNGGKLVMPLPKVEIINKQILR